MTETSQEVLLEHADAPGNHIGAYGPRMRSIGERAISSSSAIQPKNCWRPR